MQASGWQQKRARLDPREGHERLPACCYLAGHCQTAHSHGQVFSCRWGTGCSGGVIGGLQAQIHPASAGDEAEAPQATPVSQAAWVASTGTWSHTAVVLAELEVARLHSTPRLWQGSLDQWIPRDLPQFNRGTQGTEVYEEESRPEM